MNQAVGLTQLVDFCFHLGHPLQHSLTPEGVIVVGPLEPLRVCLDLLPDGTEVQEGSDRGQDHQ